MKLEDILKSKGLSDADIQAMAPMLTNQAYRTALENSYAELASERDQYRARDEEWQQLRDTKYVPALTAAEEDARKARVRAAELEESIKIAKEYGYLPDDAQKRADEAAAAARAAAQPRDQATGRFNPNDPEFQKFAGQFSSAEGDAIALHDFLGEEYRELHGKSINSYVGQDGSRGMVALRKEARSAGKPIDQYMESKFNWQGLRAERTAQQEREREEAIRRDERQKVALEYGGNPLTARPQVSRDPLIPRTKVGDKQVWEIPAAERRAMRLERAYKNEATARVN